MHRYFLGKMHKLFDADFITLLGFSTKKATHFHCSLLIITGLKINKISKLLIILAFTPPIPTLQQPFIFFTITHHLTFLNTFIAH